MKRRDLLRHLQAHGCRLDREGAKHSLWINPATAAVESVPRHAETASAFRVKYAASSPSRNCAELETDCA
jgi:mRNA interferase HicA